MAGKFWTIGGAALATLAGAGLAVLGVRAAGITSADESMAAVVRPQPVASSAPSPADRLAIAAPAPTPPAPQPAEAPPADGPFVIKRILDTGGPIHYGDYFWDEKGVPPGPVVITVDLKAQTLSAFRGGYEIGATAIIYGDDGNGMATPLGVYPILEKDADHVSNLYDAPMPYMLRLTWGGISIHGSEVAWGYATHGCIGVPVKFAKLLFGAVRKGDRVIVTNGKRLDMGQSITGR